MDLAYIGESDGHRCLLSRRHSAIELVYRRVRSHPICTNRVVLALPRIVDPVTYGGTMRVATAWQAMAQHPFRFLLSWWPWRCLLYLVSGVLVGGATFVVLATSAALGIAFFVVVVGAALLVLIGFSGIVVGRLERWRLRLVDFDGAPDPHRPPLGPGVGAWLSTRLAERSTWRELGFALLSATALSWLDATVLGFAFVLPVLCFRAPLGDPAAWPWVIIGLVALASGPYMITAWAGARAGLTRIFLAPRDEEIGAEITDVDQTKRRLLNAFEIERVRIERDLHDGAQQRLVALGMTLGLTRLDVDDPVVAASLADAQDQLTLALAELRDLVRGLNPQVLTDNGLVAAIADSAGRSAVPISVDMCLPSRLPVDIETAAYYVVAEALTNIARHSQARGATVYGRHHTDILVFEVSDNGIGGADPRRGTGLSGLADRLDVVDGRLRLSSPAGGPTVLRIEIPCRIE